MSKAAELAALIGSQTALSNRNLVINGAMQVAQRGTSVSATSSSGYASVDRMKHSYDPATGVTGITYSQEADAPAGFKYSHKLSPNAARTAALSGGDRLFHLYTIEAQDLQHLKYGTSSAQSLTYSFYLKSNLTGGVNVEFLLPDASTNNYMHKSVTISSANTWEYFSVTIPGNTAESIPADNGNGLQIALHFAAGPAFQGGTRVEGSWHTAAGSDRGLSSNIDIFSSASNYVQVTGMQLEIGEQSTPFEHRSYADELRRCQRYYREYGGNSANERVGVGFNNTTNQCRLALPLSPNMRTAPSENTSADSHWTIESNAQHTVDSIGLDQASTKIAPINCTIGSNSLLEKGAGQLMGNTSNARLKLSAEL